MNFGGTGFAFAVKDKGSLSFANRLSSAFSGAVDYIRRFGSSSEESGRSLGPLQAILRSVNEMLNVDRVQAWMSAFGGRQLHDAREALSHLTGAHMNLTTGFEAEQQQIGIAARQAAANAGFAGDAFARVSRTGAGLAGSLNRGAAETTAAAVAWENTGQYLRAAGIRSARELAIIQDTHQVSAGTLGDFARTAQMTLRLTGDQVSSIIGEYQRAGSAFGGVGAAMNQLTPLMTNLSQEAAAMGMSLNPERLTAIAVGTARYGHALYTAGIQGEHAQSAMHALNTTLLQGRQGMQNLIMGVGSELPQMLEGLSIAGGDVNQAMDAMAAGPDRFISTLGAMVASVRSSGRNVDAFMQQLSARLTASGMGAEETASVMTLLRSTGTGAMESLSETTNATSRALVQSAQRGFASGRTLEESFNRTRDAALASFRAIGRGDATQLVGSMGREFGALNSRIREVVADGGPLAMFVTRLSAAHQIGALAFIPQGLRPIALLMGQVATNIGPVLVGLYTMGFRMGMLLSPITPLLVVLGLLGMRFADLMVHGRSFSEALTQVAGEVATFFDQLPSYVDRGMTAIGNFFTRMADGVNTVDWTALWERLANSMIRSASVFWEKLRPLLVRLGTWIMDGISGAIHRAAIRISGINWTELWPQIIGTVGSVVGSVTGAIRGIFSAFWARFTGEAESAPASATGRFASAVYAFVVASGENLRNAATALWPHLRDGVSDAAGRLWAYLGEVFSGNNTQANAVVQALGDSMVRAGARLQSFAAEVWPHIVRGFETLVAYAQRELPPLLARVWTTLMDAAPQAGAMVGQVGTYVVLALAAVASRIPGLVAEWGPRILEGAQRALGGIADFVGTFLSGVLDGVENVLVRVFPQSAGTIREVMGGLREGLTVVMDVVRGVITAVGPLLSGTISTTWGLIRGTFTAVSTLVSGVVGGLWNILSGAVQVVTGVVTSAVDLIRAPITFIYDQLRTVGRFVTDVGDALALMFTNPREGLSALGEAFTTFFTSTLANGRELVTGVVAAFVGLFSSVSAGLLRIGAGVGQFFNGFLTAATQWGATITAFFDGLWATITNAIAAFFVGFLGTWTEQFRAVDAQVDAFVTGVQTDFLAFVGRVVNFFVGLGADIGAVWTQVQTTATTTFNGVVESIRTGIAQATGFVTGFKDHFLEALNGIWGRVMSLFGNSVHDVVGADLSQTNAVSSQWSSTFQQHATNAFDSVTNRQGDVTATAEQFRTALASGLSDALVGAFTSGYTRILTATTTFTRSMSVVMFRLAGDIFQRFQLMWNSLSDMAVVALASIETSTIRAAAGLARLQSQQSRAQMSASTTGDPERGTQRQVQFLGRHLANGQAATNDLFAAIHEPDWYERDYRNRFETKMNELKEAILSTRVAPQGARGNTGNTRETAAAVQRIAAASQILSGGSRP